MGLGTYQAPHERLPTRFAGGAGPLCLRFRAWVGGFGLVTNQEPHARLPTRFAGGAGPLCLRCRVWVLWLRVEG